LVSCLVGTRDFSSTSKVPGLALGTIRPV
jgi:hypothetical protein